MPELPDIAAYISALEPRIVGQRLEQIRLASPFLLRTAQPPLASVEGRIVRELRRVGKRIAIGLENDLWLMLHLMIAGRLHWRAPQAKVAGRQNLAAFDFPNGSLVLTEAGAKRRASLHILDSEDSLRSFDAGGIDISPAISVPFARGSRPKTTRSNGRSPIPIWWTESATLIPTKSCMRHNCLQSPSRKS
jgi:formamidopyrimidine-DNA glycosylase